MINKKEDLYGTEFVIESIEDSILLEAKCIELGIEKANWSGCNYTSGLMFGLIGKDLNSPHSKKLLFTSRSEGGDTMEEFLGLKRLTLGDIKPIQQNKEVEWENGDRVAIINPEGFGTWDEASKYLGSEGTVMAVFKNTNGEMVAAVSHDDSCCICWMLSMLSKPETEEQRKEREELEWLSGLACESLFGESIQNYRPDVAATVRCMIEGGYRNDKVDNKKSTLY